MFTAVVTPSAWTLAVIGAFSVLAFLATQRVWTLLVMGGVGVATVVKSLSKPALFASHSYFDIAAMPHADCVLQLVGGFAGVMMVAASLPFLGPMAKFVLRRRV
jgi:hypothetical protein